jgi:hypothetical protein
MYGDTCTPQRHFKNGPNQPSTSYHVSGDGLKQGETVANVFFYIVEAGLYMALMQVLDERGVLLSMSDDSKIVAPPEVLCGDFGSDACSSHV